MKEHTVAIINTSQDLIDILERLLHEEGFKTCSAFTREFKEKTRDIRQFIEECHPQIILYDIAIPYEENYEMFRRLREQVSDYKGIFIVTTTNKHALEKLVGDIAAFEIIGKPFDLEQIVIAIRESLS